MEFRIPYYVGPLNDAHKKEDKSQGFCWIEKKAQGQKIYPWNFEDVVDTQKSAANFILRMTNKCTYLFGEDVLPKHSILYSKFVVLNLINPLKINGELISVELKQKIYEEVFLKYKLVTVKKIKEFLVTEGFCKKEDEITGIHNDAKANMASYIDLKRILQEEYSQDLAEDIIKYIVLYGDDKTLLKSYLVEKYGKILSVEMQKEILKLKYSDWGRISRKFLQEIYDVDRKTGEIKQQKNIITMLWVTNDNLMQLLSSAYTFKEQIDLFNDENNTLTVRGISYVAVEGTYASPAVKKAIWQTLSIVKEVVKCAGAEPKRIFIEMARSDEEKKMETNSRKTTLLELYRNCRKEIANWGDSVDTWTRKIEQAEDSRLRSKRLYLYYLQQGRCLYTGNKIDISELFNNNRYDLDHIFPQSKVKDDSLDNLALVTREANDNKKDVYPVAFEIQTSQKSFWRYLKEKNFLSEKKYERLTRTTEFSENELADFIARQLVEMRQSTKIVAEILQRIFPETEIVYVKAGNVSDFRQKYDFVKVREINDYHHAKDAYLNIIVGNVYHTKFTKSPLNFIKDIARKEAYSLRRMYDYDVIRGENIAWQTSDNKTIDMVRKMMRKNNVLFTRAAYERQGSLFKQNPMKKGKGQYALKKQPSCLQAIEKYGGYNKVSGAYFILVEHERRGKRVRSIEYIPVYLANNVKKDKTLLIRYCQEQLGLIEPDIRLAKIKIDSLFLLDGFPAHLSGRTGDQLIFKGALQLCLNEENQKYVKQIEKYESRHKKDKNAIIVQPVVLNNSKIKKILITKEKNNELYELLKTKLNNSLYKICFASALRWIEAGTEKFQKLTVEEQALVILEILKLFACNRVNSDLTLINGAKNVGNILISKNLSESTLEIVHQSQTGIFATTEDLKKI